MNRLRHVRGAVPWAVMAAAAGPGLLLLVIGFVWHERSWAAAAAQSGLLLLAVPAAFLLDDAFSGVVGASPRSPWWDLTGRLLVLLALVAAIGGIGWLWNAVAPGPQPWLRPLLAGCAALLAVAAAAAFRRAGRTTPGDLVSAGLGFTLIGLTLFQPVWREWQLLPGSGQAGPGDIGAWLALAGVSLLVLLWAVAGRGPGLAVDA